VAAGQHSVLSASWLLYDSLSQSHNNTLSAFSLARSYASFLLNLVSSSVLALAVQTAVPPWAMLLQSDVLAALLQSRMEAVPA